MQWGGRERAVVQFSDSAIMHFLDGGCRVGLRVVGKMLEAQSDDCVVMTESREERRDGDVQRALDECLDCAHVIFDCFNAVDVVVVPAAPVPSADVERGVNEILRGSVVARRRSQGGAE